MMQKDEEQPRPAILRTLAFASKLFRRSRAAQQQQQQQRVLNANPYLLCENSSSSNKKHVRKQKNRLPELSFLLFRFVAITIIIIIAIDLQLFRR
jgi:hypothetical protein